MLRTAKRRAIQSGGAFAGASQNFSYYDFDSMVSCGRIVSTWTRGIADLFLELDGVQDPYSRRAIFCISNKAPLVIEMLHTRTQYHKLGIEILRD